MIVSVAIGKSEQQVRKASHCGSKQQQTRRDHFMIACLRHLYMGIVRSHPVRGESHIQRNATRGVATSVIVFLLHV